MAKAAAKTGPGAHLHRHPLSDCYMLKSYKFSLCLRCGRIL
jgi:hypothetical protein